MSVKDNIRHFALRNMTNISYDHKTLVIIIFWAIAKNNLTVLLVMAGAFIGSSISGAEINSGIFFAITIFCCLSPFIISLGTYAFFRAYEPRAKLKAAKIKENQNV